MSETLTMKNLSELVTPAETEEVRFHDARLSGVTLQVTKTLPMKEAMSFVSDIYTSCIDNKTGEYTPESFDFAVRMGVISHYGGIQYGRYDINKVYRLMYETDLYDGVMARINNDQFHVLVNAVEKRIAHMNMLTASTATGKAVDMIAKMEELSAAVSAMTEQIKEVDMDKIASAANAVQNMSGRDKGEPAADNIVQIPKKAKE